MIEFKDYSSYLPLILGTIGALLPLLIYTAVTDDFKDRARAPLCLSLFFLLVWLGYLLTVDIAGCFGYSQNFTYACLFGAILTLVGLMWLQNQRDKQGGGKILAWIRSRYFRLLMAVYIVLILCVTAAASNFLARSKVTICRFDVAASAQKQIQSITIYLDGKNSSDGKSFSVTALHPWLSHTYYIAVPKKIIDAPETKPRFQLIYAPTEPPTPSLRVDMDTMQPNLSDWVSGDSYTYTVN